MPPRTHPLALNRTLALILGGGAGTRLFPLTKDRAKPAVPFGGIYRIIDFTLSNCINSGLRRIFVLIQYKSFSLQKHILAGCKQLFPASLAAGVLQFLEIGKLLTCSHNPMKWVMPVPSARPMPS